MVVQDVDDKSSPHTTIGQKEASEVPVVAQSSADELSSETGSGALTSVNEKEKDTTAAGYATQKSKKKWYQRAGKTPKAADNQEQKSKDKLQEDLDKLDPADREVLWRQIKVDEAEYVTYATLYRYANNMDKFMIAIAYIASIVEGAALPLYTLIFGGLTQQFTIFFTTVNPDKNHFQHTVDHYTLYFLYLGIAIIVLGFISVYILVERGEVLASRIRQQYIRGVLRQNIAYFDKLGVGFITTQLVTETDNIQKGISEKISTITSGIATFICAIVIAFVKSWKLTLILIAAMFCIITSVTFFLGKVIKYMVKMQTEYSKGSIVAEEALSAIRNTVAFAAQDRLSKKFDASLLASSKFETKQFLYLAFMISCNWGLIFLMYALAFWEGSRLIASGEVNVGAVVTVILSILIGSFVFTSIAPAFKSIADAISAGKAIFPVIDRVSPIDGMDNESGRRLDNVEGHVTFEHVRFIYPSRPSITVLHDFNLEIKPGETVALVGLSGSGKSTIIGLLERFYDPVGGLIKIDGADITELNTKWLRQNIALVSQEPTLFAVSIYENICYGLIGTPYEHSDDSVKMKMVEEACKEANAWNFIQGLSQGLETNVGDGGLLMSGGQKQRIAIARAIIANPKILLLDEATSALDTKSEGIVQEALDKASQSRTTIVIAHRLSTIKDADKIVVMSFGNVVEVGKHHELIARGGAYHDLVEAQKFAHSAASESQPGTAVPVVHGESDEGEVKLLVQEDEDIRDLAKSGTLSSVDIRKMEEGLNGSERPKRSIWYLVKMLLGFTPYSKLSLVIGLIAAVLAGFGFPANSMLFAVIINSLMVLPDQYPKMRHTLNAMSGYYFMMGVIVFFLFIIELRALSTLTVKMVYTVRSRLFGHLLRMDISFFDRDDNSAGNLVSRLGTYGNSIRGLGGSTIGQILQAFAMLISCIIVAIAWDWRVGLVGLSMVPLLLGCGFSRVWVLNKLEERTSKVYQTSGSYASESVGSIRTVLSLTREEDVFDTYSTMIHSQIKKSKFQVIWSAILFALAKGLAPWIMGLVFWYGTTLMKNYTITVTQFFVAFSAVVFGAQTSATIFSYAPDMGSARAAAQGFSELMENEPNIDYLSKEGEIIENAEGNIEFKNVHFRYPTRPAIPILRGLDLVIKKGQYVALVGSSGCGKSTTISLIERFYDCQIGHIFLDGHDIISLNVSKYRENIALVQQEPILYSGTIRDNIIIGAIDESAVTNEEIYEAAKKANIHDFITSLPEGYDTACGSKGLLLSGGQKQRIAIARALIRNPKILLLDEATSALDSESEKIVQGALDEASKGRTTIAVAHRLSTIQNADIIYVFDKGVIVESGVHDELLALKGRYYELVKLQSL